MQSGSDAGNRRKHPGHRSVLGRDTTAQSSPRTAIFAGCLAAKAVAGIVPGQKMCFSLRLVVMCDPGQCEGGQCCEGANIKSISIVDCVIGSAVLSQLGLLNA